MPNPYDLSPHVYREAERALDDLRRHDYSSAVIKIQKQLDQSAVHAVARQLESSAVEGARRHLKEIELLRTGLNSPVLEALQALDKQHAAYYEQLQRTITPLPSVAGLLAAFEARIANEDPWAAINDAIREARLVWSSQLPKRERRAGGMTNAQPEPPSEQILRSAPASARPALESVDLLPLRVLDRIYNAPRAVHQLTPRQFEELVAEILQELQFEQIELTPRSADKGRDVVATKRVNGLPLLFAFECKKNSPDRKVGVGVVRTLFGAVNQASTRADVGVLVTTSTFTRGAQNFFVTEARIKGRDFNGIVDWLDEIKHLRRDA